LLSLGVVVLVEAFRGVALLVVVVLAVFLLLPAMP